jgi:hypothetical protein
MADPHLRIMFPILGTLDAIVILSSAEAIPHDLDLCPYGSGSPVRIAMVCHDRAKMLEGFIFIFHRSLQPVFTVKVHDDAALIKAVVAFAEIRFHDEGEILLICFHLQHGSIVVPGNDSKSSAKGPYEAQW